MLSHIVGIIALLPIAYLFNYGTISSIAMKCQVCYNACNFAMTTVLLPHYDSITLLSNALAQVFYLAKIYRLNVLQLC